MLFLEKSRKWERWEGKGMLFHQADQEPLSSEENKSIPFGLKQGRRYAFFRKKPFTFIPSYNAEAQGKSI